jgi:hypothetical protein
MRSTLAAQYLSSESSRTGHFAAEMLNARRLSGHRSGKARRGNDGLGSN